MDSEKSNELTELTLIAVKNNDVETIQNIWKIIQLDLQNEPFESDEGPEWFVNLIPAELHETIFN